jgi:hypothetical protein
MKNLPGACVLVVAAWAAACGQEGGQRSGEPPTGAIRARLSLSPSHDLDGVRVDVSASGLVIATRTVSLSGGSLVPGGPAADVFFVLPPATYHVTATPLLNGGPVAACQPASTDAMVAASVTTEVTLTLRCASPTGGLDVVINEAHAPVITDLEISPSKFTLACDPVALTVTAQDADGDPLVYSWSIVAEPEGALGSLVGSGPTAQFVATRAGDYTLQVTVTDPSQLQASLSFPIHVTANDSFTCSDEFLRLNPITGDHRVHLMPTPSFADVVTEDPSTNSACMPHLVDFGGPLLTSVVVTPVFWGPSVSADARALEGLYRDLTASPSYRNYLGALTEYDRPPTEHIGSGRVGPGVEIIPNDPNIILSDDEIVAELSTQIDAGMLPAADPSQLYIVHLPPEIKDTHLGPNGIEHSCRFPGFCGYHGSFLHGTTRVQYAVLPDEGPGSGCETCGGLSKVASHELIEAMTDPSVGTPVGTPALAWYDPSKVKDCGGEIADLCNDHSFSMGKYRLQSLWSNAANACVEPQFVLSGLFMTWRGVSDDNRIYHTHSSDGDSDWVPQRIVSEPAGTATGPTAVYFSGGVFVAWRGVSDDKRLYYSTSASGDVWAPQQIVTEPAGTADRPAAANLGTGIFLAWRGVSDDKRLYYKISPDGQDWTMPQQIVTEPAGSAFGPAVTAYKGGIFMAWRGVNDDKRLYYKFSSDGQDWTAPQQIVTEPAGSAFAPTVTSFNGGIFMAWRGVNDDKRLYYKFSPDGQDWTAPQQIVTEPAGTADRPAVVAFNSGLFLAWRGIDDDHKIYFKFSRDGQDWTAPQRPLPIEAGSLFGVALASRTP